MKKFKLSLAMLLMLCLMILMSGCVVTVKPYYDNDEQSLVFVEAKFIEYSDDRQCVGLFFDYTNNSDESKCPTSGFVMAVHQNEKLLDTLWVADEVNGAICASASVPTGTTRVVYLFFLHDTSPLSVEVSDGQKFTIEYEQIVG